MGEEAVQIVLGGSPPHTAPVLRGSVPGNSKCFLYLSFLLELNRRGSTDGQSVSLAISK